MTAKYAKDAKDLSQSLRPSVFLDDPVTQPLMRCTPKEPAEPIRLSGNCIQSMKKTFWNQHNSWVLNRLISDHRITRSPDHPIARFKHSVPGYRFPWTAIFFLCVALTTTGCWKQPSH